ncbi:MAG: NADH-quinone oxidoreductase subunit I [Acidobacteria bacterium]|nr:NADH-quinone oxidoreductase subunit I [Acidobacteriota bacterium]
MAIRQRRDWKQIISRFLLLDLIKGMAITFKWQAPSRNVTVQYPKVRPKIGERFRGAPQLNIDPETGESLCIACNLCAVACPENLITVTEEVREYLDEASGKIKKKRFLADYLYDTSRCMFCGYCQDVCPTYAIELTQDFELAIYRRKDFAWTWKMLENGINQPKYVK